MHIPVNVLAPRARVLSDAKGRKAATYRNVIKTTDLRHRLFNLSWQRRPCKAWPKGRHPVYGGKPKSCHGHEPGCTTLHDVGIKTSWP